MGIDKIFLSLINPDEEMSHQLWWDFLFCPPGNKNKAFIKQNFVAYLYYELF
jgi:hypothetical protein